MSIVMIMYNEIYTHLKKWPVGPWKWWLQLRFSFPILDAAGHVMLQLGVNNTKAMPQKQVNGYKTRAQKAIVANTVQPL